MPCQSLVHIEIYYTNPSRGREKNIIKIKKNHTLLIHNVTIWIHLYKWYTSEGFGGMFKTTFFSEWFPRVPCHFVYQSVFLSLVVFSSVRFTGYIGSNLPCYLPSSSIQVMMYTSKLPTTLNCFYVSFISEGNLFQYADQTQLFITKKKQLTVFRN